MKTTLALIGLFGLGVNCADTFTPFANEACTQPAVMQSLKNGTNITSIAVKSAPDFTRSTNITFPTLPPPPPPTEGNLVWWQVTSVPDGCRAVMMLPYGQGGYLATGNKVPGQVVWTTSGPACMKSNIPIYGEFYHTMCCGDECNPYELGSGSLAAPAVIPKAAKRSIRTSSGFRREIESRGDAPLCLADPCTADPKMLPDGYCIVNPHPEKPCPKICSPNKLKNDGASNPITIPANSYLPPSAFFKDAKHNAPSGPKNYASGLCGPLQIAPASYVPPSPSPSENCTVAPHQGELVHSTQAGKQLIVMNGISCDTAVCNAQVSFEIDASSSVSSSHTTTLTNSVDQTITLNAEPELLGNSLGGASYSFDYGISIAIADETGSSVTTGRSNTTGYTIGSTPGTMSYLTFTPTYDCWTDVPMHCTVNGTIEQYTGPATVCNPQKDSNGYLAGIYGLVYTNRLDLASPWRNATDTKATA